jgi:hypothetical protein
MCISNELCSEIAVALLVTKEKSDCDLTRLKEIVLEVHATLQQMREVERAIEGRSRWQRKNYQ